MKNIVTLNHIYAGKETYECSYNYLCWILETAASAYSEVVINGHSFPIVNGKVYGRLWEAFND